MLTTEKNYFLLPPSIDLGLQRLSLRADDHPDPLDELRRLYDVAGERFLHVAASMPTRENFSGVTDRRGIDAAIGEAEACARAEGRKSRSFATPLPE